jgi:hypothetical protein
MFNGLFDSSKFCFEFVSMIPKVFNNFVYHSARLALAAPCFKAIWRLAAGLGGLSGGRRGGLIKRPYCEDGFPEKFPAEAEQKQKNQVQPVFCT